MELMSSLNLVAKNSGGIPTFERIYGDGRVAQSHIQITLVSESIAQQFMGWIVLEDYNGSLHRFITYNVTDRIDITANHRNGPKWSWKKYDAKKLKNYLASTDLPLTDVNATEGAVRLDKFLNEACDSCMPKGMYKGGKLLAYWWTQNIANFKKECPSHRRKCKRNRQRNNTALQTENLERYNEARKKLKWEIQRKDIPGITLPGRLEHIVDSLFPSQGTLKWSVEHETFNFPSITIAEIKNWANKIPAGWAPGPDGVPDLVIKEIVLNKPEKFQEVFNLCLNHGIFPKTWKTANLVLFRKGTKPLEQPPSYRSISLLNTIGKFFERIIAIVATDRTTAALQAATNEILMADSEWLEENGLQLSINKTEAVILTTKRGYNHPEFMLKGINIDIKKQIRYLGVELNHVWGYGKHIEKAAAKASSTASNLVRIMADVGGASHKKRKIFGAIVYSQTQYASPVWTHAFKFNINKSTFLKPQRLIALRIAMVYRTVFTQAILVVASIIPAHLMALERLKTYKDKTGKDTSRKESFTEWQDVWNKAERGRWTKRMDQTWKNGQQGNMER
ncbi:hypothetical protein QTP88_027186 [Uroleucon formosanum]